MFALPFQQADLTAADGVANDSIGISVAISGSTAVVGAPGRSSFTGAAYVAELTPDDGPSNDLFGYSVAIAGATAVVGAYAKNLQTGAAYVFASI